MRVAHPASEHLVAAAESEHPAAGAGVRDDVVIPALGAQEGEVAEGRLGAHEQHDVGIAGQRGARRHEFEVHGRFHAQRVGVVEVGDAREPRGHDPNPLAA